jgi:cysteinyl-tRNA synthetase
MSLRLHNTLSGQVEPLLPHEPSHFRIYVCGPTVYDYSHIGHMRSALTYDVLVRHLRAQGKRVTFVRNITDVDDKILNRAKERGETPAQLAQRFEAAYREDTQALGMLAPDIEPRVSDHIAEIVALIEKLIARGAAYASHGDVYFSVAAFPEYGKLSHRKLEDLELGRSGRLDDQEQTRKRHPADFALWKGADAESRDQVGGVQSPGTAWESPWGKGRPGWHIECSAMSMRYLGASFDVHGGGLDLVFPHHENEIAQSEAATGQKLCSSWVHHGFIEVNKEKMSKSLGNFFTARECFKRLEPEAMRYFVLTVHYRAPLALDWTVDDKGEVTGFPQMEEAERRIEYLYRTKIRLAEIPEARIVPAGAASAPLLAFPEELTKALNDDLNMPLALAATAELLKTTNELVERALAKKGQVPQASIDAAREGFALIGKVLGLGNDDPHAVLHRIRDRRALRLGITEAYVLEQIEARKQARADRDFARADAIRNDLLARGVELMDSPAGTAWRIG